MKSTALEEINVIGLALLSKTTNKNGQSSIDCGNLWLKFESGNYVSKIPGKLGNEIFAVYHEYEGDHMQAFSYFIGCKVKPDTTVPDELQKLTIPQGTYQKFTARGKMPGCVADTWKQIWDEEELNRKYTVDFEVYDEKSKDWNDAKVNIYVATE